MNLNKIIVSGVGCALVDLLYTDIRFHSDSFQKYVSKRAGDGGLSPGKLVFTEELEHFSSKSYPLIVEEISDGNSPAAFNVGGPGLVSLIHAAQMLPPDDFDVRFFGVTGNDSNANIIFELLKETPLDISNFKIGSERATPFTDVFSDPTFDHGQGERTFVNNIGAAWDFSPENLPDDFFQSHLVCFGGTALVPQIHDHLLELLTRAKQHNCITIVNTVYDFRNEKANPNGKWPLGKDEYSFSLIDVLIMDREEALKLCGQNTIGLAAEYLKSLNVPSFFITNGSGNITVGSNGKFFKETFYGEFPVSASVAEQSFRKGDTTGCGDNFAGGIIASIAEQLQFGAAGSLHLQEALSWAVASGGFACSYIGGTFFEQSPKEKRLKISEYQQAYLKQIELKTASKDNKLVLFGAGRIGRSFIGQLFSEGGYEVVFVDIFKPVIDEINSRRNYKVILKDARESVIIVENVRGIPADDIAQVAYEISTARLLTVSVGMNGLKGVFPLIASGLLFRYKKTPAAAIDIIIAENLRAAADYFETELLKLLPKSYPFHQLVGLVETSIGKMVPIMEQKALQEDILQVFAEPYNTLILDRKAFRNPIPEMEGLAPKDNMKAWVDRKLFIHNLGHAATAYLGHLHYPQMVYIHEVLEIPEIISEVRAIMQQAAQLLIKKYPSEFNDQSMTEHIDDLLNRFMNKALGDTIFRVGCDLPRKLGSNDRLSAAIKLAIEMKMPYDKILFALVCGCHFRATDPEGKMHPSDVEFTRSYDKGIKTVLSTLCDFDPGMHKQIFIQAALLEKEIGAAFKRNVF